MAQELIFDSQLNSRKNLAWWLYVFHGASLVFSMGLFSFIPLIISYVKRADAYGTFVYSHHNWQIRTFWWYVVWVVVASILWLTLVGIPVAMLVFGIAWVWKAYRLIKGLIELNDNKPMPA